MKLGGRHIARQRIPLANVHLTLLNKFGIEQKSLPTYRNDFGAVSANPPLPLRLLPCWIARDRAYSERRKWRRECSTLWASPLLSPLSSHRTHQRSKLTDKLAIVDGGGSNVLAFRRPDGLVLVDTGSPTHRGQRVATLTSLRELQGTHPFQYALPSRSDRQ